MLFDPCLQFADQQFPSQASLHSILPDYDDLNVSKLCDYFEGFDFFDLAFDHVDHVDRLITRCLKPKTSHAEVEEIIELIQNLAIYALSKRNNEVYQACCNGLWRMGKKYIPLIMANNKKDLSGNFHLRLKVWTCLFRICCYHCFKKAPCGVADFKEDAFVDGISVIQFGSLMNIAKLKEKAIPCSCVLTSWKTMIPTSMGSTFLTKYYSYFELRSPSVTTDDTFFKTAYAFVCSLSCKMYITVFYALFPAFFQDKKKAGGCLERFHSKIPFDQEIYENLIECFSQNPTFISHCEKLLNDFANKINNIKDTITTSYFPDEFSSLPSVIEEYCTSPQRGDDIFQLFIRLFAKSLNDSDIGAILISRFETFWAKSKVPKVYSFYLMLLATAVKILGPQYVLSPILSLTDICPQECLFLRFFVLQRTSDFKNTYTHLKSKIMASASNFSSFIKAFPSAVAHSPEPALMFNLIPKEVLRSLSTKDVSTFIEKIHRIAPLQSYIFEMFQRDLTFDKTFVTSFFAFHLSASSIPPMEKVFTAKFLTLEFIEKVVEATVRQEKNLSKNAGFVYQLALLYSFTKTFMMTAEGKENFTKLVKHALKPETMITMNDSYDIGIVFDTALNKNEQLCLNVFSKQIFGIIDENVKNIPECIPNACKQMCEILLSESFVKMSHAFKGSANDLPLTFVLDGFIKRNMIQKDLPDTELHLMLLKKLKELRFPPMLFTSNAIFITKFKKNLDDKIEDLSF